MELQVADPWPNQSFLILYGLINSAVKFVQGEGFGLRSALPCTEGFEANEHVTTPLSSGL